MKVPTGTREMRILSKGTPRDVGQSIPVSHSSCSERPALSTAHTGPFPAPAVGKATFPVQVGGTSTACTWAKLGVQRQPWSGSMSEDLASHGL